MIKDKIQEEMILQKFSQTGMVRSVNKLSSSNKLTQPQLSNFLHGKKLLSISYVEAIFEVLEIKLIRMV